MFYLRSTYPARMCVAAAIILFSHLFRIVPGNRPSACCEPRATRKNWRTGTVVQQIPPPLVLSLASRKPVGISGWTRTSRQIIARLALYTCSIRAQQSAGCRVRGRDRQTGTPFHTRWKMKLALLFAAMTAIITSPSSAQEEPCCSSDADCIDLQNEGQAVSTGTEGACVGFVALVWKILK